MKIVNEELRFRTIAYPQLSKLPHGVRLVKQDGFPEVLRDKYGARVSESLFLLVRGRNKKQAKSDLIFQLNQRLRSQALIWKDPTSDDYRRALGKSE